MKRKKMIIMKTLNQTYKVMIKKLEQIIDELENENRDYFTNYIMSLENTLYNAIEDLNHLDE